MNIKHLSILFFLFTNTLGYGQAGEKKIKMLPVPTIGYSPETKTSIGAVTLFTLDLYNDSCTRISNAKLEFNYTWNKQMILESEWNYFFKEEKWFTKGTIHYSKYPDLYYGIGARTSETNKLQFDSKRFVVEALLLKNIGRSFFTGANLKYRNYSEIEPEASILNYSELVAGSTFGIGYSLLYDSRNSILTPTKGFYSFLNSTYNFSENNYLEFSVDMRYYKTWKGKYTLANRLLNDYRLGDPPFFDQSLLGGDKFVRGYYLGRYRDNNRAVIQSEFRFPAFWKIYLAAFGGFSNVYSEKNRFRIDQSMFNYGFGFRFLVDKTENTFLRFDYAMGRDNSTGFYISFGESF